MKTRGKKGGTEEGEIKERQKKETNKGNHLKYTKKGEAYYKGKNRKRRRARRKV